MAKGHYIAQESHVVPLVYPQDAHVNGVTGPWMSLDNAAHVSILVALGQVTGAPGAIQVMAAQDNNGTGAVAIPFDVFKCETSNTDVLGTRTPVTSAGFTPPGSPPGGNIFYVIEIDVATAMASSGAGIGTYNHLALKVPAGGSLLQISAVAVLSALRFEADQGATVLV
jgi:hypothetical protein